MPPHTNLPKLGVILGDFCKLRVKIAYSEGDPYSSHYRRTPLGIPLKLPRCIPIGHSYQAARFHVTIICRSVRAGRQS